MSTLGGSKGERNAKPKFSALDINRLHKNSRGESVEPTAQKNQVPRKHGMQSLGKVPSTRRPPANLPSLKAEVRLPGTNTTNSNSNNSQTSGSIVNNNNNNTSSTLTSSKQENLLNSSSSAQGTLLNHHQHQNHSSSTANQASSSSLQQTLTNSSSSSVTWSSVTTGHDTMGGGNNNAVPPHYQSPQFQHEFPSLDGSVSGNKGSSNQQPNREGNHHHHQHQHQSSSSSHHSNHQQNFRDGNTGNGNEVSLRPQTDAASWHQRNQHQKEQQMQEQQLLQQTGGNSKFNANDTSINNQSGDGSGRIGGGQLAGQGHQQHHHNPASVVPPPLRALMPSFMMRGSGDSGGSGSRSLTPPAGQHQSNGSNYQQRNYQQNRSASPNFLRGQGGKRPSPLGRGGNSSSPYESEAVLQQRPIIKEEELERMNALAKSDGWALPDEIDYNKQLALSDDESPENTPTVERDRPPQFPKIKKDEKQNGHRPSTNVDQAALERAKLRKEEEERREHERRDGARKKLYELEMKMGASGPNVGATTPTNVEIDEDGGSDQSQNRRQFTGAATGAGNRFQRQQAAMQAAAAAAAQTNQTSPPSGGGGGGRPPPTTQNTANYEREGRDSGKQVPFAQQYDPRYIHSQQNYKQQQQQRRSGGYGRNRSDNSENDDEFSRYNRRSGGDSDHQGRAITRSISDSSSNRKISCSSNDEPQRSDSRDHLPSGSWADESDIHIGRRHRDESFSSSHSKADDMEQGHVKILQRPSQASQSGGSQNKSLSESSTKNEKILEEEESESKSFAPTQILRRTESPKPLIDNSLQEETNKADIKDSENDKKDEKSPHSGSHGKESLSDHKKSEGEDSSGQTLSRNDQKRPSPRSTTGPANRSDIRGSYSNRGGYNSYGSSNRGGGGWSRRGGGNMRNDGRGGRHYNDWSESENSELGDDDYNGRRNDRSPKNPKKDHGSSRNMSGGHKEGFAPRGEPSRRGRGGGGNLSVSSSSYRRGGSGGSTNTVSSRRNDSYNSKSGFPSSSNDDSKDKSLDDVKKRDLEKKDEKKGTTPPKSSSSSSVNSSYQHTRKESTSSSKNEDFGKRDDKKDNIPQRSASSGQIKSSPGSTTTAPLTVSGSSGGSAKKDDRKPSITKPPPGYNTAKSTVSPQSQPQIAQKISNPNANQVKSPSSAAQQQQVPQQWVSATDTSVASVTSTSSTQILDGSSAPVNTIIFENTNYKTTVSTLEGTKQDSSPTIDSTEALTASLTQMSLTADHVAVAAEYEKEMKIGAFGCFDAEFPTRLTSSGNTVNDDKSSSLPRSSSNSSVATSASDLNLKIASVKKVWDTTTLSPLMEQHNVNEAAEQLQQQAQQMHHHQQIPQQQLQHLASHIQHAYTTFEEAGVAVSQDAVVDVVKQAVDVNKVKASVQQQQQQLHHPSNLGLSPPPSLQQQQQQQQLQHQVAPATQQFYPPSQYPTAAGIPTIPSPPVLFNSSGIAPSQSGMYPFIEPRSQFSQFPTHYGTTGTGAPYNAYAMQTQQMQTAPPQAQNADFYTNLRSAAYPYRMSGTVQSFNQNQQINNPNTVLISSSSNSLISASAKPPSSQQLGTIGSKNNVDAAIASVNYGQQYMNLYQQQGPPPHGGHHSQIPSNSYYSNSAGAYFSAAANSGAGTQSYGMFGGHAGSTGGSHSTNGPPQGPPQQIPNFSSQFQGSTYNTLLAPAALNQFRNAAGQQQSQQAQGQQSNQQQQYIKATNQGPQNHLQDSMGRQLKSPLGADVTLNLGKPIQPQQSPPHHKNYSQSWDMNQVIQQQQSQQQQQQQRNVQQQNQMNSSGRSGIGQGPQRYPAPIQRPTNYPQHPAQQNQQQRQIRHEGGNRSQGGNNGPPMNKHYYGNSGGNRGQHPSNQIVVDQHKNPSSQLDKDGNVATITQQEMTVKEDNSND